MGWNLALVLVVFVLLILSFIQSACISRLHDRAVYLEKHVALLEIEIKRFEDIFDDE